MKEKIRLSKRKKIDEMTKIEKKIQRRKWNKWDLNRRAKKKMLQSSALATPPETPSPQNSGNKIRGKKSVQKSRSKIRRRNEKLEKEVEQKDNELMKWKKKFRSLEKKYHRKETTPNKPLTSPMALAKQMVAETPPNLPNSKVVKTLTFHSELVKQLKPIITENKNLSRALLTNYIQKRRLTHFVSKQLGFSQKIRLVEEHKAKEQTLRNLITEFYLLDDVSRSTAGVKETITKKKLKSKSAISTQV